MSDGQVRLQLWEVGNYTKWVFRAAGIPAGYRLGAQKMVQYAEMFHADGIAHLASQLARLSETPYSPPVLKQHDDDHFEADSLDEMLLLHGPVLLDLACGEASLLDQFRLSIRRITIWEPGLFCLVDRAAMLGFHCQIRYGDKLISGSPTNGSVTVQQFISDETELEDGYIEIRCWQADKGMSEEGTRLKPDPVYSLGAADRLRRSELVTREGLWVDSDSFTVVKQFANKILVPVEKESG